MSNQNPEFKSVADEISQRQAAVEYYQALLIAHAKRKHGGFPLSTCHTCGQHISTVNSNKEIITYLQALPPQQ